MYIESQRAIDILLDNIQVSFNQDSQFQFDKQGYFICANQSSTQSEQIIGGNITVRIKSVKSYEKGQIAQGAILQVQHLIQNLDIQFEDSLIKNYESPEQGISLNGTVIYANAVNSIQVKILNSEFSSLSNQQSSGALMYLKAKNIDVMIVGSKFENIVSKHSGTLSVLVGLEQIQVLIDNSTFQQFGLERTNDGGVFLFEGKRAVLKIQNQTYFRDILSMNQGGIAFYETEYCNLTIENSEFQNIYWISDGGGFAHMKGLYNQVDLFNVQIYQNYQESQVIQIGQIYMGGLEENIISIRQSSLRNLVHLFQGSFIHLNGKNQVVEFQNAQLVNTSINNGIQAPYGGVIYSSSAINFTLVSSNSSFIQVSSKEQGSFLYIDPLSNPNITISLIGNNYQIGQLEEGYEMYYQQLRNINDLIVKGPLVGSLFYIQNGQGNIYTEENNFKSITATKLSSVFYLPKNFTIYDKKSFYYQCEGQYGLIFCDNCTIVLDEITVINWQAQFGGLVYMIDQANVLIKDSTLKYGQAQNQGGGIFAKGTGISIINIVNSNIFFVRSNEVGGLIYADNPDLQIIIDYTTFELIFTETEGGLIYAKQARDIKLSNSFGFHLYFDNTSGSIYFSEMAGLSLHLDNNYFEGRKQLDYDEILYEFGQSAGFITNRYSVFCLTDAKNINSFNNTFKNFHVAINGTIFYIKNAEEFRDEMSTYNVLAAYTGGVFKMFNVSQILVIDSTFDNITADIGGIFFLKNLFNTSILNCSIQNVKVNQNGGLIFITNEDNLYKKSYLNIQGYNIQDLMNFKSNGNGALAYINDSTLEFSIVNYKVSNFNARLNGGLIYVEKADTIFIDNLDVKDIQALIKGSIIFSIYNKVKIKIQNSNFIQDIDETYNKTQIKLDLQNSLFDLSTGTGGAFYFLNTESLIEISNITVKNFHNAYQGGVFYLENTLLKDTGSHYYQNFAYEGGFAYCKNCQMQIFTSKFDNQSGIQGGVIYSNTQTKIEIFESSFINTYVVTSGGFLYSTTDQNQDQVDIQNKQSFVKFYDAILISNFQSDLNSAGFHLNNPQFDIIMNNSMMTLEKIQSQQYGNVFYIESARRIEIDGIIARDIKSSFAQGSFLYSNQFNVEIIIKNSEINCQNSIEEEYNQIGQQGSAIYLKEYDSSLQITFGKYLMFETQQQLQSQFQFENKCGGTITFDEDENIKGELNFLISEVEASNLTSETYGAFLCSQQESLSLEIQNVNVTMSKSKNEGGIFHLMKINSLKIQNSFFENFQATNKGSLISTDQYVNFFKLNIQNNTFIQDNIETSKGDWLNMIPTAGMMYLQYTYELISINNSFSSLLLSYECGVYSLKNGNLYDENSTYKDIGTQNQGGIMCLTFSDATLKNVFDSVFSNVQSGHAGGIARYKLSQMGQMKFKSCKFQVFIGRLTGIFDIESSEGSILLSSDFKNYGQTFIQDFYAYNSNDASSSLFYSNSESFYLEMTDLLIDCELKSQIMWRDETLILAPAIKIKQSKKGIISKRNTFKNCQNSKEGSIFSIQSSTLIDEGSEYYNNSAEQGGILSCTTCTVKINGSNFHHNQAQQGGIFIVYESYDIVLDNVQIWENKAIKKGGVFFVNQILEISTWKNDIVIKNCYDIRNIFASEGGFLYSQSFDLNLTITNSTFYDIQAALDGGLLSLNKGSNFYLRNLRITKVTARDFQILTSIAQLRNFTIENCQIICDPSYEGDPSTELNTKITYFSDYESKYIMNSAIFGGVFHISQSGVFLNETQFQDNKANRGGCIDIGYDSYLSMNKVSFQNLKKAK
ncbi:UNKNOWN [Stylonychia lemnae]|uniref:Uncharacterized protein n=1 Tax=Stylonychia lemnae TaxID=5949 RepID=A0A078A7Q6_STYLE|nr:UNKNOWN [Stylonychia lemnae]|eukprot:CDW78279.1 UNKNOWN [Stylonychia lemnae]